MISTEMRFLVGTGGRIVSTLGGDYNLSTLGRSLAAHIDALIRKNLTDDHLE